MEKRMEFRLSLPNEPSQIALVAEALGQNGINIISIAALGIVHPTVAIVTNDEDKTRDVLNELGVDFEETELLTIELPNVPGELGAFTRKLANANINIESIYILWGSFGDALFALTVNDIEKAKQVLGL